ncbi:hypothetical protein KBX19_09815 [Corynebacterium sp. CCUG 71335]|uniref:DUF6531 domain-containing protein n=1 Tax=Corynebacterium sp. CCUG 71335 TaxID=2823892 RepID=UPI00210BED17|nr:DUF6531 domain-containing protein [Corynebacterium sp. CCUG 71335]MCQ4621508.1 hypothetical protein [Corynebacterium sp. CCUG 71335]
MIPTRLRAFYLYYRKHFDIGGDTGTLHASAGEWRTFGQSAIEASSDMKALNASRFFGDEGDKYRELVNAHFPSQLTTTGDAHTGVGDAIRAYAEALAGHKIDMDRVTESARRHHREVNDAVDDFYRAGGSAVLGGPGAGEAAEAYARYQQAKTLWDADIADAERIKAALKQDVETQVGVINGLARESYAENPNNMQKAWDSIKDFFVEHSETLKVIADILQAVGAVVALVCAPLGLAMTAVGLLLKAGLAASGAVSWKEIAVDAVLNMVPGGKLGQTAGRALKQIVKRGDPIDMATGAMIDEDVDVFIEGILPLTVTRCAYSTHAFGQALGPRWVSSIDCRLQINYGEVLMLTPEGAIVTFPPAPVDGSEVRGVDTPWLLSFGDGAYRVRAVELGLTYTFRLFDLDEDIKDHSQPATGIPDESPSIGGAYVAATVPTGSLANHFGGGIDVGVSSVVHHTGASIEYSWDTATGYMTQLRRSDDTVLHITWDKVVGRVAEISVSNPTTHRDQDPERLISYEYDPHGQLIRVINSGNGALQFQYDDYGRPCGWTDRNGVSYVYRFDDCGRVISQVGTGGFFPNVLYWTEDLGEDAPEGGKVCVLIETAAKFENDPLTIGDGVISEYLKRLENLPLYRALLEGGLEFAGLTGRGRTSFRDDNSWSIPEEWLRDELLGDIRPSVFRSNSAGDVWRIVTPEGVVEDFTFNKYHQRTSVTNSAGATTAYTYNDDGIITATEHPDGTRSYMEPASWGAPSRIISSDGLATEYIVDAFGIVQSETSPTGATTAYVQEYRPTGIVPSRIVNPDGTFTSTECDDAGRLVASVDAAGRRTSFVRNVRGLITETIDPVGAVTTVEYTPEGWPTTTKLPDGSTSVVLYDGEGNPVSTKNEDGAETTTAYTAFDKPLETTDETGAVTRFIYNSQMELVELVNADGNSWSYSYNLDGAVVEERDYNGIATINSFNPDELSTTTTTPAGTTQLSLDPSSRIEEVVDRAGVTSYKYDDYGRLLGIEGPQATIEYTLDEYGRAIAETLRLKSGETTKFQVEFDNADALSAEHVVLPSGDSLTTTYLRNEASEITSSTHLYTPKDSASVKPVTELSYGVDERGIRNYIAVDSVIRRIETDDRGRTTADTLSLLDSHVPGGLRKLTARHYEWRSDGALERITDHLRGATVFDLDAAGRAVSVSREPTGGTFSDGVHQANTPSASRDLHTNLDSPQFTSTRETYGFSTAGVLTNIDIKSDPKSDISDKRGTVTRPSEPPTNPSTGMDFTGTLPTRVGRTTYQYDSAGRVTQTSTKRISRKPLVQQFFYGNGEQPIGFTSSDEPGIGYRYIYDPYGRRVAKERVDTHSGEVRQRIVFLHAGDQLIAEQITFDVSATDQGFVENQADPGQCPTSPRRVGDGYFWTVDPDTRHVTGQIRLSALSHEERQSASNRQPAHNATLAVSGEQSLDVNFALLMTDLAGSPQELVEPETGSIIGRCSQTLYGVRQWHGTITTPLLYAGQYLDIESGWAYNRFRYYHPNAGVYNAQDPLGVEPRIASAQGYVDHAAYWVDLLGLKSTILCNAKKGKLYEKRVKTMISAHAPDLRVAEQLTVKPVGSKLGRGSRVDYVLEGKDGSLHFIEVKSGGSQLTNPQKVTQQALGNGNSVSVRTRDSKKLLKLGLRRGDEITGQYHVIHADQINSRQNLVNLLERIR